MEPCACADSRGASGHDGCRTVGDAAVACPVHVQSSLVFLCSRIFLYGGAAQSFFPALADAVFGRGRAVVAAAATHSVGMALIGNSSFMGCSAGMLHDCGCGGLFRRCRSALCNVALSCRRASGVVADGLSLLLADCSHSESLAPIDVLSRVLPAGLFCNVAKAGLEPPRFRWDNFTVILHCRTPVI